MVIDNQRPDDNVIDEDFADNREFTLPERARPRRRRWVVILLLPLCGLCWWLFSPFIVPEAIGYVGMRLWQSPNSERVASGYCIYGSSDNQEKGYLLWSEDSVDTVLQHYEKYFPAFTLRSNDYLNTRWWHSEKSIATRIMPVFETFGYYVTIIDATQNNRNYGMLPRPYYGDEFLLAFDALPYRGTIIVFEHDIYAP